MTLSCLHFPAGINWVWVLGSFLSRWKPQPSFLIWMGLGLTRTTFAEKIGPSILTQLGYTRLWTTSKKRRMWSKHGDTVLKHTFSSQKRTNKMIQNDASSVQNPVLSLGTGWSYNRISEIVGHDNPQHFSGGAWSRPKSQCWGKGNAWRRARLSKNMLGPFFLDPKWSKGWLQLGLVMNLPDSSKWPFSFYCCFFWGWPVQVFVWRPQATGVNDESLAGSLWPPNRMPNWMVTRSATRTDSRTWWNMVKPDVWMHEFGIFNGEKNPWETIDLLKAQSYWNALIVI